MTKHPYINSTGNSTFHMIIMQSESMKEGEKEFPRSTVPSTHVMPNTKVSRQPGTNIISPASQPFYIKSQESQWAERTSIQATKQPSQDSVKEAVESTVYSTCGPQPRSSLPIPAATTPDLICSRMPRSGAK